MNNPPPIPPRPPGFESSPLPPPPPPRRNPQPQPQQQQQQQQPQFTWGPLFHPDGVPTELFEAFMAAFFRVLDPQNTGKIWPETLSSFLDACRFTKEDNIWKANYKEIGYPYQPIDNADFELKAALEAWYFDHEVVHRDPARAQIRYGGTPLLSLEGFTQYMAVECAGEPERSWRGLRHAMRHYGVWIAQTGEVPRGAFPAEMPRQVKERIDAASRRSLQTAQSRIDAVRVEGQIAQRGREAALELIGNVRYVDRYY